jgi:hypothetical protein
MSSSVVDYSDRLCWAASRAAFFLAARVDRAFETEALARAMVVVLYVRFAMHAAVSQSADQSRNTENTVRKELH